ncbi:LacI family DNA-binding transcriptional regulator [Vibrio aestuarianus]|uniref:LacI family DNA-binding transcriptional regulator n=1 Tax=Vibrio aestuarianus TaxID=28171 RepID=UPI00237C75FB|nr:LacI family DNA-binding transcriptional regulator [Vibrio aestuarianus]MDE1328311.1 LacI family transcriptional regulator [Vibrio aestuarianus]
MATINDVCKAAGVSKATVSRVINQNGQVKESTRNAVLQAMKALGYQPNVLAQALATNSANAIGLILPQFQGSYFGTLLHQAAQGAQKARKTLLVMDSHNSAEGEQSAVQLLQSQRCDAIMLYSRHLTNQALKELQATLTVPLVILNRTIEEVGLHSFGFEQQQSSALAMKHLLALGHNKIACIASPLDSDTGRLRFAAYQAQLEQAGIAFDVALTFEGDNMMQSGYAAIVKFLEQKAIFSAILACNDDMALGAMRALHEYGLSIPSDVSVIGIDDEPAAAYSVPSLSTVSLPIEQLTKDAVELALQLAERKNIQLVTAHRYLGQLIQRESTASATC